MLRNHCRQDGPAAVKNTIQIHGQNFAPRLRLHLREKRIVVRAGIVHQYIEALVRGGDFLHRRLP